ncbi:CAP domain-containing protein [Streptomyces sp. NBC_00572]|uniref:CAP domain-containing protein n=1 Tax=Streptomyces sp. NBC_00572 TaxID=2903664 RepID=UPI002256B33E|nr:CAP domain-containing protein [Streptomyces sp. NBC_00572]MCX4986382.1 CAP domain-containing protein [Streptomyces sp. NBC_00572]
MRYHDRPGHPEDPEHTAYLHDVVRGFADDPVADEDPAARASGRHRKGGGARRRPRRPSFRTAVTLAGAAAAVLTVATGVYVASPGSGDRTPAPSAAEPVGASVAQTVTGSVAEAVAEPAAPLGSPDTVSKAAVREARPTSPTLSSPSTAPTPSSRTARTTAVGSAAPESRPETPPKAESERQRDEARRPGQSREQRQGQEQRGGAPAAEAPAAEARAGRAPAGKVSRFVHDVIALANAEREKAGCGPLHTENQLRTAAQGHADDMSARDYYEHDSPEGRDAGDRMSGAGYVWSTWGENIHRGPTTPARAMEDWMDSPGHRANILNCSFKDIGVGVTLTANGPWWVQNFGARR